MKFQFTKDEALAIYKVAKMMAEADGVVLHKELKGIEDGMDRLSIKGEEFDHVVLRFVFIDIGQEVVNGFCGT